MKEKNGEIRELTEFDLDLCAELLITVYNSKPWDEKWTKNTAKSHLQEFIHRKRSFGFVYVDKSTIVGALFGVERTFWSGDEVYVDEFYVHPQCQQKGVGKEMMIHLEDYCQKKELEAITLVTDKNVPAYHFYQKMNFNISEANVFLYKNIPQ
ncbi:GNAT family N-acetyltransferase [Carnobacterium sp.]|uniref:GNAT family N-acetyltransferase n=1 Tax=Carnobacterium sp. TaxID=48221 RepID=UPI00388E3B96